jgi:hypothetical protein
LGLTADARLVGIKATTAMASMNATNTVPMMCGFLEELAVEQPTKATNNVQEEEDHTEKEEGVKSGACR